MGHSTLAQTDHSAAQQAGRGQSPQGSRVGSGGLVAMHTSCKAELPYNARQSVLHIKGTQVVSTGGEHCGEHPRHGNPRLLVEAQPTPDSSTLAAAPGSSTW